MIKALPNLPYLVKGCRWLQPVPNNAVWTTNYPTAVWRGHLTPALCRATSTMNFAGGWWLQWHPMIWDAAESKQVELSWAERQSFTWRCQLYVVLRLSSLVFRSWNSQNLTKIPAIKIHYLYIYIYTYSAIDIYRLWKYQAPNIQRHRAPIRRFQRKQRSALPPCEFPTSSWSSLPAEIITKPKGIGSTKGSSPFNFMSSLIFLIRVHRVTSAIGP